MFIFKVIYNLIDDRGTTSVELPIILELGTFFQHETGKYQVTTEDFDSDRQSMILECKKISN